jgi:hypothetical protein
MIRRVDRPAARLDGTTDRLIHLSLPPRDVFAGSGPVEFDDQLVHCAPPYFQPLTASMKFGRDSETKIANEFARFIFLVGGPGIEPGTSAL